MDGLKKPELQALTTVKDRITFLYVERCKISRDSVQLRFMMNREPNQFRRQWLVHCCWDQERIYLIEQ